MGESKRFNPLDLLKSAFGKKEPTPQELRDRKAESFMNEPQAHASKLRERGGEVAEKSGFPGHVFINKKEHASQRTHEISDGNTQYPHKY